MSGQPVPAVGPFSKAWWTSNTPHRQGMTSCDFRRWAGTHAGPHGTGWKHRSTAVPLATGIGAHKGVQLIAEWILDWQEAHPGQQLVECPRGVVAWAATEAAERYEAKARAKGLLVTMNDATATAAIDQLIREQTCLVEGLTWVWALVHLPGLLAQYRLVAAEQEDGLVLDCTCGLGDAITDFDLHSQRGCEGIYYQTKCDQLWQHLQRQTTTYVEFKTWGSINIQKRERWKFDGQLRANMEAASRKFGVMVDEAFVVALLKGWRGRDKGAPPTDAKYQHSVLCYGYMDEGAPPIRQPEFALKFRNFDVVTGKNRQLPGSFKKTPVWEMPIPQTREGASIVESWITNHFTPDAYGDCIEVLGPFPRQQVLLPQTLEGIKAEERRWRADVEMLREQGAVMPDHPLVDATIARSWECLGYDATPCEFGYICFREAGWQDPETTGRYERRRPHHAPEAQAVIALGHQLPESDDDEFGISEESDE